MQRPSSRGQVFSFDLVFASVAFFTLLLLYISYTSDTAVRLALLEGDRDTRGMAEFAADALLYAPGSPADWEERALLDVNAIGLVSSPNFISERKLSSLSDLNATVAYETVKDVLGLAGHDLNLIIADVNGVELFAYGVQTEPDRRKVVVERIASYNQRPVRVKLEVWQ